LITPCTAELFDACGVLFGLEVKGSLDFLKYLQKPELKAAFRRRAFETHPDRARILGEDKVRMNERFKEVSLAYEKLSLAMKGDRIVLLQNETVTKKKKQKKTTPGKKVHEKFSNHFYTGRIPKRELLIGQFLYYSGLVSWNVLINAIVWQRRQRLRIGQIALDWGMLSKDEIHEILMKQKFRERFGECAIREGFLTPFNLMALLGKQRRFQNPIGKYFIERGIIHSRDMEEMVKQQRIHNWNVRRKFPFE